MYRKTIYNGVSADAVTPGGAQELSIDVARDGIAGRGSCSTYRGCAGFPGWSPVIW
jgi:hypothetical protein